MKVLFAVHDEKISSSIVKKYQKEYKEIISYKNVYYFNAILKELQRDKSYNRIIIDEDLEEFSSSSFEQKDKFIFEKLDNITDEATDSNSNDIPIILICSERRTKSEEFLIKLFGIGIYNAIVGNDRSTDEVCRLIKKPRSKKEAKAYYRIDSDEAGYQPERMDDVSEEEMQHILSYFKKLGKNEQKYVDGFKNIVSQYNEKQLKIIISILPANVKVILEENSPEYQKLVTTSGKRSINNYAKNRKLEGTSEKLLLNQKPNVGRPIIVPSKLEKTLVKEIEPVKANIKVKPEYYDDFDMEDDFKDVDKIQKLPREPRKVRPKNEKIDLKDKEDSYYDEFDLENDLDEISTTPKIKEIEEKNESKEENLPKTETQPEIVEQPVAKKKRGRPRKNPEPEMLQETPAKKRGRPKKAVEEVEKPVVEEPKKENNILPGFEDLEDEPEVEPKIEPKKFTENVEEKVENEKQNTPKNDLDELDDVDDNRLPGFEEDYYDDDGYFDDDLPELDDLENGDFKFQDDDIENEEKSKQQKENIDENVNTIQQSQNDNNKAVAKSEETNSLEDFQNNTLPGFEDDYEDEEDYVPTTSTKNHDNTENTGFNQNRKKYLEEEQKYYDDYDYSEYNSLLSSTKKVMVFVGTSKNGTSFMVNNIAKVLSDSGIDTAILDATQNKNAYYIYTKNDEDLRQKAARSLPSLINGNPEGVRVKQNLTVYTELPNKENNIIHVGPILENIIKQHSAVLIDCDFNTPMEYFKNAQELYLIQSMDVLTIQPFTAFLRELKSKNMLDEHKLKIIINKTVKIKGVSSKTIVGGMAYYNDPEMSFMTELFDRNSIVPIDIPFDPVVYQNYLEGLIECEISTDRYPKDFVNILKNLACVVYPLLPAKKTKEKAKKGYQYSATTFANNGFSDSVNNTLNNMKKKY